MTFRNYSQKSSPLDQTTSTFVQQHDPLKDGPEMKKSLGGEGESKLSGQKKGDEETLKRQKEETGKRC